MKRWNRRLFTIFTLLFNKYLLALENITDVEARKRSLASVFFTHTTIESCDDKYCLNGDNCDLNICRGCPSSCYGTCTYSDNQCNHWCMYKQDCSRNKKDCASCWFCDDDYDNRNDNQCSIATFEDKTDVVFSSSSPTPIYWNLWKHSAKPYFHEGAPLFFDLNGDKYYFNSMHGHPLDNIHNRLELGISTKSNLEEGISSLKQVSSRIIFEEDEDALMKLDLHGEIIADLDGDGYLDIYISNGGGMGLIQPNERASTYDNILLWGEPSIDDVTGDEITIFRGGRNAARRAGIEMRRGRGRFIYTLDINGDELLDLYNAQDRVVSNELVPGVMLINQGDRTWKEDRNMMEFTRSMLLTDANGDGYANEIVLNRSFCFPQRSGPDPDPKYPNLGSFPSDIEEFCSSRPVGTTAVYRYNSDTAKMEDISKKYMNFYSSQHMQPSCCPHGSYSSTNNCHATSIASGDFDGDEKADHIFLFSNKMVFYFSSDRINDGALPGDPNYVGLELNLPEYCAKGISVRVIDLDNDGTEEIFVICENAGTFLIYSKGLTKTSWTLDNGCNDMDAMGDISNRFLASPTYEDLNDFCENQMTPNWKTAFEVCKKYTENGKIPAAKTSGATIVDLNNDGLLDIVVSHSFGYLRFFYNTPSFQTSLNRHIIIEFGAIKSKGLGASLVLHCADNDGRLVTQFRELSAFYHAKDTSGTNEGRIVFGLGQKLTPEKLIIRWPWPIQRIREIDLSDWEPSQGKILSIRDIDAHDHYFSDGAPSAISGTKRLFGINITMKILTGILCFSVCFISRPVI